VALKETGPELGDKIAAVITANDAPPQQKAAIKQLWEAIGAEIVNHFLDNAVVKPGIGVQVSLSNGTGMTNTPGSLL
jgi:hypothetical protein